MHSINAYAKIGIAALATAVSMLACDACRADQVAPSRPIEAARVTDQTDGWTSYSWGPHRQVVTERTIHPAKWTAEDATRSFLPPDHEMTDANSAMLYLQASGFFQQQAATEWLLRFNAKEGERMSNDHDYKPAPYRWWDTAPKDLDLNEVREYLSYFEFQTQLLDRAHRCREFDLHRNARQMEQPADYLLPEVMTFRKEVQHTQTIRSRMALAEDRIDDAVDYIGQNFHLAHHLSHDSFLPSTQISQDIARRAFQDAVHLVCHPDCPNLYDAIARLPEPLINQSPAIAFHRNFLFYQIPALQPFRSAGVPEFDTPSFVDRVLPLFHDCDLKRAYDEGGRAAVALYVAESGDEADRYLLHYGGLSREDLQRLSLHQRFFKAMVQLYDHVQTQRLRSSGLLTEVSEQRHSQEQELLNSFPRLINSIAWMVLEVDRLVTVTQRQIRQRLALLQTIESIRDHLATHQQFPNSLDGLHLPVLPDPVTGKPIHYARTEGTATLTTANNGHESIQMVLTAAASQDPPAQDPPAQAVAPSEDAPLSVPLVRYHVANDMALDQVKSASWWLAIPKQDRELLLASIQHGRRNRAGEPESASVLQETNVLTASGELVPVAGNNQESNEDFAAAKQWADKHAISVLVVIPDRVRTALQESLPKGAEEPLKQQRHKTLALVATQTRWAGVGLDLSQPSLEITIQCVSPEATAILQQNSRVIAGWLFDHFFDSPSNDVVDTSLQQLKVEVDGDLLRYQWNSAGQDNRAIALAMTSLAELVRTRNAATIQANYRQIMLAIHNYHAAFSKLPPHAEKAHPVSKGLSWRVHVLPFIKDPRCRELYARFKLDEPWDSPHNKPLIEEIPEVYAPTLHNPESAALARGMTTILAPDGPNSALGVKGATSFRQILDGLSNTVFLVEVEPSRAVVWTAPADFQYDRSQPTTGLAIQNGRVQTAMADGKVLQLSIDQPEGAWNAIFTYSGKEDLRTFWQQLEEKTKSK